jgi:hypothetical protein
MLSDLTNRLGPFSQLGYASIGANPTTSAFTTTAPFVFPNKSRIFCQKMCQN